jgi:uncharacterized protein YoxC
MMTILYQCTIFIGLTFIAIVIAIFVFASSIHGGASRLTAEEEANLLARRKERIQEVIRETKDLLSKQQKGHNNERVLQEWEAKIAGLTNDLKNIDRAIREAKNKAKALTVGQIVIIPSSLLLTSGTLAAGFWEPHRLVPALLSPEHRIAFPNDYLCQQSHLQSRVTRPGSFQQRYPSPG